MATPALFQALAKSKGLNAKTMEEMSKEDYNTIEMLQLMEPIDLEALNITLAQRHLLKRWILDLHAVHGDHCFDNDQCWWLAQPAKEDHVYCDEKEPRPETDGQEAAYHKEYDGRPGMGEGGITSGSARSVGTNITSSLEQAQPTESSETDIPIEQQVQDCLKNLNIADFFRDVISNHIRSKGVLGLDRLLEDQLYEYMGCAVNIAVVGRSGTGKSSLINSLRNLRARDKHAAAVGVTETTMKIFPYLHPTINGIILWDVPGVNTPSFPRDTYLDDIEFGKYDAFIIVCTDRVTADDIWLATETQKYPKRPYYFVRTKIDQDIANDERDGEGDEAKVLQRIRQNIHKDLVKGHLPDENVFLVSGILRLQPKWDFPKLTEKLTYETPAKNRTSMVLAMVSCTKDLISVKVERLRERILTVSLQAASVEDQYDKVIHNELVMYTESLGVTDIDFEKWGVNIKTLAPDLQKIKRKLNQFLKFLSLEERVTKFLIGGVNYLLGFFNMSKIVIERYERHSEKRRSAAKLKADRTLFEVKRQAAENALETALTNCEKLALGVLEARRFVASNLPM